MVESLVGDREAGVTGSEREVTLRIDGMHCGSCIRRVTQAINQAGPFQVKEVRLGAARFSAAAGTEEAAVSALAKAGFTARVDE